MATTVIAGIPGLVTPSMGAFGIRGGAVGPVGPPALEDEGMVKVKTANQTFNTGGLALDDDLQGFPVLANNAYAIELWAVVAGNASVVVFDFDIGGAVINVTGGAWRFFTVETNPPVYEAPTAGSTHVTFLGGDITYTFPATTDRFILAFRGGIADLTGDGTLGWRHNQTSGASGSAFGGSWMRVTRQQ